jgi:hypothetical protein
MNWMSKAMSLNARKEMVISVRNKYRSSCWSEKGKILDGFIAATGYERKYAIRLLNQEETKTPPRPSLASKERVYDDQVRQALIIVWRASNQICSKRLIPFMSEIVGAMERHGHLKLPDDIKKKLLNLSAATADRLLRPERDKINRGISRTTPGTLLKHQIKVRTFADWDDVVPGFAEIDLVAHCGGQPAGQFLNTLVGRSRYAAK